MNLEENTDTHMPPSVARVFVLTSCQHFPQGQRGLGEKRGCPFRAGGTHPWVVGCEAPLDLGPDLPLTPVPHREAAGVGRDHSSIQSSLGSTALPLTQSPP